MVVSILSSRVDFGRILMHLEGFLQHPFLLMTKKCKKIQKRKSRIASQKVYRSLVTDVSKANDSVCHELVSHNVTPTK